MRHWNAFVLKSAAAFHKKKRIPFNTSSKWVWNFPRLPAYAPNDSRHRVQGIEMLRELSNESDMQKPFIVHVGVESNARHRRV